MNSHRLDIAKGERFAFGSNWSRFLGTLSEAQVAAAESSLQRMLETTSLAGRSFLDVGSGSGLFSLAARRLGATVRSFDYDPQSVACTLALKQRYFPDDVDWHVEEGSALDEDYIRSLGEFDVVYAWGVLHHTGDMWRAMQNTAVPVRRGGELFIAIYNDQGRTSERWAAIKRLYCSSAAIRPFLIGLYIPYLVVRGLLGDLMRGRNPTKRYADYSRSRGMSIGIDALDWLGGYPFEVAKPEAVFEFYRDRGFSLRRLVTVGGGLANNQFVFERVS